MKKIKSKKQIKETVDQSFFLNFSNPRFLILLVGLIVFMVYFKALGFDFVNFDDYKEILKNEQITNFSFRNFIDLFVNPNGDLYIPLVNLSFNIEHFFFGFNPKIFHFTNISFHLMNSILVFWISFKLFQNIKYSFILAILFGIHPFRVESVVWIIERKDVMYAFFFLLSFLFYHLYKTSENKKYYFFSILLFVLSCFSKPMAVTLPAVLIVYDYFYLNRRNYKIILDKLPFFLISGLISILAVKLIDSEITYLPMIKNYNLFDHVVLFFHSLFFYFEKSIFPFNLSAIYNYPTKHNGLFDVYYYITSGLAFFSFILIFYFKRKDKILIGSLLLYLITISPVIQIFPNTYSLTADRYSYLPSIFLVGYLIYFLFLTLNKRGIDVISQNFFFFFIGILFAIISVVRLNAWKNSETLYVDILAKKQETPAIMCNYVDLLVQNNRINEAVILLKNANNKFPKRSEILARLGNTYFSKKQYKIAVKFYSEAVKIDSSSSEILTNLGASLINLKDYYAAIQILLKAYKLDDNNAISCYNLGYCYWNLGDIKNSKKFMEKASNLNLSQANDFINENL